MTANSKIEWTDHTFNPWIGCTKVSPACDHCYAELSTPSRVLSVAWGPHAERRRTSPGNWAMPRRWNAQAEAFQAQHGRRQRVFCASLADVFDNAVEREWRDDLATLILDTPNLDWLLLTKRIGNAGEMLSEMFLDGPPDNLWLGATIANQKEADRDIARLLAVPAARRFLSMEPLLGPITLPGLNSRTAWCPQCQAIVHDELHRPHELVHGNVDFGAPFDPARCCSAVYDMLHWVIVGGESGPQARPMHPDWARSLRDQCTAAGVPFFFKQWGEWLPLSHQGGGADPEERQCHIWPDGCAYDGEREEMTPACAQLSRVGKKAAGRLLDGREWNEVPR